MSRGLGEVQQLALQAFRRPDGSLEDGWVELGELKCRAWGERTRYSSVFGVTVSEGLKYRRDTKSLAVRDGYLRRNRTASNYHQSFKRALEMLQKRGLVEARWVPDEVHLQKRDCDYRLTDRGKLLLSSKRLS
jgi:hypothetical protein